MAKALGKSWIDEAFEKGEKRGELLATRKTLRSLQERRFGPLPQEWVQRIESATNERKLSKAILKVLDLGSLDDLKI